jgi:hypothetical protein
MAILYPEGVASASAASPRRQHSVLFADAWVKGPD